MTTRSLKVTAALAVACVLAACKDKYNKKNPENQRIDIPVRPHP